MESLTEADPRPGDVLGEFRILGLIGQGAMGKVYEARQESLQRRVALKVLPAQAEGDTQAVTRFYREARAAARLTHPHIVPVYGFGVERGVYYYAMEFVQGPSLHQLIHDPQNPLRDEKKIAKYLLQVALALDAAHKEGVIHRDVKPANILVREDDQAAITDFGLSRQERKRSITQAGALMGTPVYMAPEQARGDKVDGRIDVYALGVCLYECLTGHVPFLETKLRELLVAITSRPPEPISVSRPGISPDLEAITLKALSKAPEQRYATAKDMGDDLIRYFRGDVALARQAGPLVLALRAIRKHKVTSSLTAALVILILTAFLAYPSMAQGRATARAKARLADAKLLIGEALAAYREAADRLAAAREAREGRLYRIGAAGRAESQEATPAVTAASSALRQAEEALLQRPPAGDSVSGAERSKDILEEVLALLPLDHPMAEEARDLTRELVRAQERHARSSGQRELAEVRRRELLALIGPEPTSPLGTRLTVVTEPPAQAMLYAITLDADGYWKQSAPTELSRDALAEAGTELPPGEFVLELSAPSRLTVRAPFVIQPGQQAKQIRLELPRTDQIPTGFAYLPPSEFAAGGDPQAVRPLFHQLQPLWVPGVFIAKHELTVREYVEYLRDLPAAARALPRGRQIVSSEGEVRAAQPGLLDLPVCGVSREEAQAYCAWRTQRDPRGTYRLPSAAEWEKAARGPAGRCFPWGDRFDLSRRPAHMQLGRDGPIPPGSSPRDRSIYDVFDLGGNLAEWVDDGFGGNGDDVLRGGSWAKSPEITRSASREPVSPLAFEAISDRVGFRLAFDP